MLSRTGGVVAEHSRADAEALLATDGAPVWVDIGRRCDAAVAVLTDVLHCHPPTVRDGVERHRVPPVRIYPHQQLLIRHGPERGPSGHVHYLELDQIVVEKVVATPSE